MMAAAYPRSQLEALFANPRIAPLWTSVSSILDQDTWPECQDWQKYAAREPTWPQELRFSPVQRIGQRRKRKLAREKADPNRPTLRRYETAICEAGEIPTREADLHDYFNALIWLQFPLAKYALHRATWLSYQTPHQQAEGNRRSLLADALTRFDEGGMVYFASPEDDVEAIKSLFQKHSDPEKLSFCREHARRFAVFGHGLLEAWCLGGRGFTASLLIVEPAKGLGIESHDPAFADRIKKIIDPRGQFGTVPFDAWLNS